MENNYVENHGGIKLKNKIDIGKKFGRWTVNSDEFRIKNRKYYSCICDCGKEKNVEKYNLLGGKSTSCGCLTREKVSIKNTIDLTGQRFGRLTVIEKSNDYTFQTDEVVWKCKCDCGNYINIRGYSLRSGNTKSCGCLFDEYLQTIDCVNPNRNLKDLTGKIFGKLTVLYEIDRKNNHRMYHCKCECGNYTDVQMTSLSSGKTRSCGCLQNKSFYYEDISNQKFGKLTTIKYIGESKWLCECDCGNKKEVLASNLKNGLTKSCGCLNSKGEYTIQQFLSKNDIKFKQQYCFDDCVYKKKLKFDFAILDDKDNPMLLIEFDGEQHFKPSRYSKDHENNVNRFNLVKKRDDIKNKYCIDKNIRLLRIPYWDFDNIEQILSKELGLIA